MPTSDYRNIGPILSVFAALHPRSMLDVGCGFGKYGMLLREYFDVWDGRVNKCDWCARIDGVDACARYRNPIWDYAYDQVLIGDIRELAPTLSRYDAILMSDVIGSLPEPDARELVASLHEHAEIVVVATPKQSSTAPGRRDHPFAVSGCPWTAASYPPGLHVTAIPALACTLFVSELPARSGFFATPVRSEKTSGSGAACEPPSRSPFGEPRAPARRAH